MRALNHRQEAFVRHVVSGVAPFKAYVLAGYKPDLANPYRLTEHDGVKRRIAEFYARSARKTCVTRDSLLAELEESRAVAQASGNASAMLSGDSGARVATPRPRKSKHGRSHASNLLGGGRKSGVREFNDRADSLPDEAAIGSSEWQCADDLPGSVCAARAMRSVAAGDVLRRPYRVNGDRPLTRREHRNAPASYRRSGKC